MITASSLNAKSMKDLGKLAERHQVANWRTLKKEPLMKAIIRATQAKSKKAGKPAASSPKPASGKAKGAAALKSAKPSSRTAPNTARGKGPAAGSKGAAARSGAKKILAAESDVRSEAKSKPVAASRPAPKADLKAAAKPAAKVVAKPAGKVVAKPAAKVDVKAAAPVDVKAATKVDAKTATKSVAKPVVAAAPKPVPPPKPVKTSAKSAKVQQKIKSANAERERHKNLAGSEENGQEIVVHGVNGKSAKNGTTSNDITKSAVKKDRVVLLVRDAYWLQAVWELTRQSVERAQVALAQQWHTARPVLRLIELESNSTTSAVEQVGKVIAIHGGVNTWFIDVQESPKTFRVDVGYMTANGKFFALARSNTVTTPRPGSRDGLENNWSDIANDCEKIYALSGGFSDESPTGELQEVFEERLGRPMNGPSGSRFGVGADKIFNRRNDFQFEVDAEMIIFGRSKANARVTLAGNPIKLRPDGTFAARLAMPDRRQVLPIVASSADGVEQHTVVIAVERNTKVMEPMVRESSD